MTKKKFFKGICKTFGFIFGFFVVVVLLLFFRLSIEPIHITNWVPSIVNMAADSQMDVSVKDAYIQLAFSKGRLMDVCFEELLISDKKEFVLKAKMMQSVAQIRFEISVAIPAPKTPSLKL